LLKIEKEKVCRVEEKERDRKLKHIKRKKEEGH